MKRIALLIASLVIAAGAFAQQAAAPAKKEGPRGEMRGACREDAQKFCKDVKPGGGRVIACLQGQHDNLSAGCKQEMDKMKERRMERKAERKAERQQQGSTATPTASDATKK
ncbi:MAG TPA: cysteine rich repeat-containing protein [bacterium]